MVRLRFYCQASGVVQLSGSFVYWSLGLPEEQLFRILALGLPEEQSLKSPQFGSVCYYMPG